MKFIKKSGLPETKVKYAIVDNRVDKGITSELQTLGINTIKVDNNPSLQEPISAHSDMNVLHLGDKSFYVAEEFINGFDKQLGNIDCEIFNNSRVVKNLGREYPYDVLLNAAIVGDYIICNQNTVSKEIIENSGKKLIPVNQGYTKCSIAVVTENALITDDIGIYNSIGNLFDVLLIERGQIELKGYNYGFIGGATGKIKYDELAFYGNLKELNCSDRIISFCRNHGVYCYSLSKQPLYDYGSLLPIIET